MPQFVRSAHHKHMLAVGLTVAAWLLMALSAFSFRPDIPALEAAAMQTSNELVAEQFAPKSGVTAGFWWMLAGGLSLGAALWLNRKSVVAIRESPLQNNVTSRIRWRIVLVGIAVLWIVAEASGDVLHFAPIADMSHHIQFILFCAGIALVGWGMLGKRSSVGAVREPSLRRWHHNHDLLILTAIILLAFGLRFWHLSDSLRVLVDELHFMGGILEFWKRPDVELMQSINSISPFARLYTYWQSGAVALLGRDFLGFRAVSALMGTANVLAIYWMMKALFDRKTALLAALLLATFPPHLHFSRLGIVQAGDMLFGSLVLAFIARGLKHSRRADWIVAGIGLGLTQYFYEGGRFLFPLVTALWLGAAWLFKSRRPADSPRAPTGRQILLLIFLAVIVAMPYYYTIATTESPLTGRFDASGFDPDYWAQFLLSGVDDGWLQAHLSHLTSSFLVYVNMPERAVYYGGYHPFVLEIFVPVFLMGVWYVVWRGGTRGLALLLWVAVTSIGSGLLVQSAVASRFVVVFPALAALLAVGLRYGVGMLFPDKHPAGTIPELPSRFLAADPLAPELIKSPLHRMERGFRGEVKIIAILGILIATSQAVYYFADHLPTFNAEFRHAREYRDVEDAILRAQDFPPETRIHIIMRQAFDPNYNRVFLYFLTDNMDVDTLTPDDVTPEYLAGLSPVMDHAFFIEPDDTETLSKLRTRFDLLPARYSPYLDVAADEQFVLYFAPLDPDEFNHMAYSADFMLR